MKYRDIIKKVENYSGLPHEEAEEALQTFVEVLAVHLTEGERKDFASELPEELEDIALSVWPTSNNIYVDIVEQVAELQDIEEAHAAKEIKAVWHALKDVVNPAKLDTILSELPRSFASAIG